MEVVFLRHPNLINRLKTNDKMGFLIVEMQINAIKSKTLVKTERAIRFLSRS